MRVGEIRPGSEVGSPGYRKSLMMWSACVDCGATRWVAVKNGHPTAIRCRPCAMKRAYPIGENVSSYSGAHVNTTKQRGPASEHQCECGKRAAEWAYTHDDPCPSETVDERGLKFSTDVSRYKPMCRRCHRLYDKEQITHCPEGHEYADDNLIIDSGKRKCRTCVYARNAERRRRVGRTPEQKERALHLQRLRRAAARAEAKS